MSDFLINVLSTGDGTAIAISFFGCLAVYLIIFYQRKSATSQRNKEVEELQEQINDLSTTKELMQKDIDYLKSETTGLRDELKEIKASINQMAMSIERISATLESLIKNGKD